MTEPNRLVNFERGSYEEQVCEISLNIGQQFKEMRFKYVSFLALVAIVFVEQSCVQFGGELCFFYNLDQHFRRSFRIKIYSLLFWYFFCSIV